MRKKNVVRKNLLRTIKGSLGRYIAIVGIIALGSAMFVGLLSTKSDMVATGQKYMDRQNMFDLRLISTYGWTQKEVDAVSQMPGVSVAEGLISLDAIAVWGQEDANSVYKLHSIPENVNQVYLMGGRMPENPNECLMDGKFATDAVLGTTFQISLNNDDATLDSLQYHTFTVVGYVGTPLYMDMSRGSTSIGNGTVAGFMYLPKDAFQMEAYTEIAVRLEGNYAVYSDAFNDKMEAMSEELKPAVLLQADARFEALKLDAEDAYREGYQEYTDGLAQYEKGREEALQKLADGLQELQDAQSEIDENRAVLDDAMQQLADGQKLLDEQAAVLEAGRIELADGKNQAYAAISQAYAELMENYKTVREAQKQVADGLAQIDAGLAKLDEGIAMLEDGLEQLADGLEQLDMAISMTQAQVNVLEMLLSAANSMPIPDADMIARLEAQLTDAQTQLDGYLTQKQELQAMQTEYTAQLADLKQQRQEVVTQRQELLQTQKTLDDAMAAIEDGMLELESSRIQTENQFAAAEAQLESGRIQLEQAQKELDAKRTEAEAGLQALNEAQAALDKGFAEYEQGKAEAEAELAEAKAQLDDAAAQLADARVAIDTMDDPEVYILDRNSNVGYLALNNNSDIVAGVSRVFPAFFLLVAALVCITTMTRMVEEERTQIGTFKALGYGSAAIIRKYLIYAGSAAVIGCGLGTLIGSAAFPMILWDVYGLLLHIPGNVVLLIDWPLCLAIVGAYTAVVLLVTWYCCHKTLREVPAELIRPKAPTSGKKIWLEYLPFWKHIGFLNKVMLRNVFRYRQRMLMMLAGIGGCTALLLTGFGLRDSIVNIVSDQFDNVTHYDMQLYFSQGQTQESQDALREELRRKNVSAHFFYQTSVELEYDNISKELNMIVTDEGIKHYINFRQDDQDLTMPGVNEAFLSVGMADQLGLSVGDKLQLRNSDLQTLEVTITGIYHNNVYNYIILTPETLQAQWGSVPLPQMAVANVASYADVYQTSAEIAGMPDVMNVTVSQEIAEQVEGILGALDSIVVVVVVCAGTLAMIVLYNLTNINITERIREIATIKVLGFRSGETAAYVFKENLLLSGMGTVFGLFLGHWLLVFVISQIKVDLVWITPQTSVLSCVISVVLTMLSACLVDFLLYFKLEKINMAEALKSVE